MGRTRFLGLGCPGLKSACDHVAALSACAGEMDLSRVTVVVPGGRVGRNLRALLAEEASRRGCPLSPPQVVTPGGIADSVLKITGRTACAVARRLAWAEALRRTAPETLAPLIPTVPAEDDLQAWLAMGDLLGACHTELAAGLLRFEDVPARCGLGAAFLEEERWNAAAVVQGRYRRVIEERGLVDPDLARMDALREPGAARVVREGGPIVLVGVSELSKMARAALAVVEDRVTALVLADETMRDRFDEWGCPRVEAWERAALEMREEQIVFADGPSDQAARAFEAIAALDGALVADQIAIGVVDEELVGPLERGAELVGVEVRYAGGTPVRQTGPWKLLETIATYLERHDCGALRGLLRHPDVERRVLATLAAQGEPADVECWLSLLDDYAADSLHGALTGAWHCPEEERAKLLERVYGIVEALLAPLREPGARPAPAWADPLLGALAGVYADRSAGENGSADGDRLLVGGCRAVSDAIAELRSLPGTNWPAMTAVQAARLVMQQAAEASVPQDPRSGAIEMLGWLELPLDASEAVVVVGMNMGKIPASYRGDSFLCERVREGLGIACARQRFARDAYVLTSILRTRRSATLIAGRRAAEGEAIWPSRLLTACAENDLATRVRRFLGKAPDPTPRVRVRPAMVCGETCGFPIAPVATRPAVNSMRVTSFRTYLSSPYLFYLQDVLGLRECGDPAAELDGMTFGSLLHGVVEAFARSDAKHSTDPARIGQCLQDELSRLGRKQFGDAPRAAVGLQLEIARRRLASVAQWQAGRARQGWLIDQLPEWTPSPNKGGLLVDGVPMRLRGRIDRIERHAETGALAILDFKTGDKVKKPEQTHRGRNGWRDLQLPLYRHLAAELGVRADTVLGYVVIPSGADGVEFLEAGWNAAELAEADAVAHEVVRAVRKGEFDAVGDGAPDGGVLAALCGTGILGAGEEEPGEVAS